VILRAVCRKGASAKLTGLCKRTYAEENQKNLQTDSDELLHISTALAAL